MVSPYWCREVFECWWSKIEIMKGDSVIGQVTTRQDAEQIVGELNQMWYESRR